MKNIRIYLETWILLNFQLVSILIFYLIMYLFVFYCFVFNKMYLILDNNIYSTNDYFNWYNDKFVIDNYCFNYINDELYLTYYLNFDYYIIDNYCFYINNNLIINDNLNILFSPTDKVITLIKKKDITKLNYLKEAFHHHKIHNVEYECLHSYKHIVDSLKYNDCYYFPLANNHFKSSADGVIYYKDHVEYLQFKTIVNKDKYINLSKYNSWKQRYDTFSNILEVGILHKDNIYNHNHIENIINFSEFNNLTDKDFKIQVNDNLLLYKSKTINPYHEEFIKVNDFYINYHYGKIKNLDELPKYNLELKKDEE